MKKLPEIAIKIDTNVIEIYVLVDPGTKKVKYVGQGISAKTRYVAHLFKNPMLRGWINKLEKIRLKPELYLLEIIEHKEANKREKFWINYFGFNNLLNQREHCGGKTSYLFKDEEGVENNGYKNGARPDEIITIR